MKMRVLSGILILSLVAVLAADYAYAGTLTVSIRQPFTVGEKSFPAGHYRILADDENDQYVNIRNLDTETDSEIPFETRLSAREGDNGSVVFDKVGNELHLAKIYIVGMDGFFFEGVTGKHRHLVVKEEIE